jgi:hypothetical protein
MSDLTMNILGFAAVNRDLKVELREPVTQRVVREVKPFLDGTVRIPNVDAGAFEVHVIHPNLVRPVLIRPIHILPVGETTVTVMIDPSKFRNTPIEDIPEANLTPVADLARSIGDTVAPLASKIAGEAIRSSDWNALAGAVRDLAGTTGELTRLVSPIGHNHPELEAKIGEMSSNFQTLIESMSQALAELQRQIQMLSLRRQMENMIDATGANDKRPAFEKLIDGLDEKVTASPTVFSRAVRNVAFELSNQLDTVLVAKPDAVDAVSVTEMTKSIELLKEHRTSTYSGEISFNRKLDRSVGGGALQALRK